MIAEAGLALDAEPPELGQTLGEELLTPTTIYARDCLALAAQCAVHAYAHITGGGLAANLARVLPPGTGAIVDRGTWRPAAIFGLLAGHGGIAGAELERVLQHGRRHGRRGSSGRRRPRRAPAHGSRHTRLARRRGHLGR